MVVTAEYSHHIPTFEHSIEKAAVQLRVADRLAEETDSRKFCPVLREEIPRDSAYQIVELGVRHSPVVIVISEADGERQIPACDMRQQVQLCTVSRRSIDDVSGKDYQIRFFEIQQLFHSLEHNVTSGILLYIM